MPVMYCSWEPTMGLTHRNPPEAEYFATKPSADCPMQIAVPGPMSKSGFPEKCPAT